MEQAHTALCQKENKKEVEGFKETEKGIQTPLDPVHVYILLNLHTSAIVPIASRERGLEVL